MKTTTSLWTTGYAGCHSSISLSGGDPHGKPNPHQKVIWWISSFKQGEYIKWILLMRDDIKGKWNHMGQKSLRFLIPYTRHRWELTLTWYPDWARMYSQNDVGFLWICSKVQSSNIMSLQVKVPELFHLLELSGHICTQIYRCVEFIILPKKVISFFQHQIPILV